MPRGSLLGGVEVKVESSAVEKQTKAAKVDVREDMPQWRRDLARRIKALKSARGMK